MTNVMNDNGMKKALNEDLILGENDRKEVMPIIPEAQTAQIPAKSVKKITTDIPDTGIEVQNLSKNKIQAAFHLCTAKTGYLKLSEVDTFRKTLSLPEEFQLKVQEYFNELMMELFTLDQCKGLGPYILNPTKKDEVPIKGIQTKIFAYDKCMEYNITQPTVEKTSLPYKYRCLLGCFSTIEDQFTKHCNPLQKMTFGKLKNCLQAPYRRSFTVNDLAQIKSVFPEAYSFTQEILLSSRKNAPAEFQLVITPTVMNMSAEDRFIKLLERKQIFEDKLRSMKEEYNKFLVDIGQPMRIVEADFTKWHTDFDVESCHEIEKAQLPQPPVQEKSSTVKKASKKGNNKSNGGAKRIKTVEMLADGHIRTTPNVAQTTVTDTTDPDISKLEKKHRQ